MKRKAHFIGICGVGMSGVAKLLKDAGWDVSGSDSGFYPPASTLLKSYNISYENGYRKENIPVDVNIVVIGKNAKLTPENNEEVRAAFERGISMRSFPEILGELTKKTKNIVVAGSWGKSTCTALLSWCLLNAGKDPSYFVGAIAHNMKNTACVDRGNTFVLEGDEYPSANWDITSKFLYYNPHDVLLTSAEHDHVNVFPTHDEYLLPFQTLLSIIPKDGLLVACADEPHARKLAQKYQGKTVFYSLGHRVSKWGAGWYAANIRYGKITTFDLLKEGEKIVTLSTTLLGKHNVQNIVGVAAMLLEKKLLTPEELARGVASFKGITRRLDLKTKKSSVLIYEGFGSSYEKARAAYDAIALHFPKKRLITIFEPHTFSWRNRDTIHWYDDVFKDCKHVLIYEPATQGAGTHKQLTQQDIVERVQKTGINTIAITSPNDALKFLEKELRPDDVVLLMTSGDLGGLIESVPEMVEKKFPK